MHLMVDGFFWVDGSKINGKYEVEVLREYKNFYLVRRTTDWGSYTLAINKADLICGDVEIKK